MTIQLIAAALAFLLGLKLPDIDLAPLLFRHRSAFTHGPLWAMLIPLIPLPWWGVYVPLALLAGIAIHLAQDTFPKGWHGMANINTAPFTYTFKPWMSFLYIAGSCVYTALVAWRLF